MNKAELRKLYRQKRDTIDPVEREKLQDRILINFQTISLPFVKMVHTYIASVNHAEFQTDHIIRYLEFKNPELQVAAPRIEPGTGSLINYLINDDTEFLINEYGIAEPDVTDVIHPNEFDLILVPLLCFDESGCRVGYGKGYYDKFLAQCREDVIKIGFSFFEAEAQIDDINEFDIPLNFCITPQQVYNFQ
ncbi:5-formyltetrahydrofolate cyclo-ligase [soil metagenome]